MPVIPYLCDLAPEMMAWRQDFHRHPELLYDLPRTSAQVAQMLRDFGCDEVVENIAKTGVVGVINGRAAGPSIGLRADMDALPIYEKTNLDYRSLTEGKMHACGHDGHMSMLLGAAKYLAETRDFAGRAICIFQPAEEGGFGGKTMVDEGVLERFDIVEVYGMHNKPGLALGEFAMTPGAIMAAADQFSITVTGRGGHAAQPQEGIDTTLVAAQIIVAAQSIVSRNVGPLQNAVVSICSIASDSTAHNVIPHQVTMRGSMRYLDPKVGALLETRLRDIIELTARAFGASAEFNFMPGYPVTANPASHIGFAQSVAEGIGQKVDPKVEPMLAAEDFSFMLNQRPGAYIFIGNGDSAPLHHPEYNFNDAALPYGASWFAQMIESRLA